MQQTAGFSLGLLTMLSAGGCGGGSAPALMPMLPPTAIGWHDLDTANPPAQPQPIPAIKPVFPAKLTPQQIEDGWVVGVQGTFDEQLDGLLNLVWKGKEDALIEALEKEPLFNTYEHAQKGGLLMYACGLGKMKCSKYLIEHGANPNAVSLRGAAPLEMCITLAGNVVPPIELTDPIDLLLSNGADATVVGIRRAKWKTERDVMVATDTFLEFGVKLQRSKGHHRVQRNAVIARLREHLELPVDAMLPINAPSLYLEGSE